MWHKLLSLLFVTTFLSSSMRITAAAVSREATSASPISASKSRIVTLDDGARFNVQTTGRKIQLTRLVPSKYTQLLSLSLAPAIIGMALHATVLKKHPRASVVTGTSLGVSAILCMWLYKTVASLAHESRISDVLLSDAITKELRKLGIEQYDDKIVNIQIQEIYTHRENMKLDGVDARKKMEAERYKILAVFDKPLTTHSIRKFLFTVDRRFAVLIIEKPGTQSFTIQMTYEPVIKTSDEDNTQDKYNQEFAKVINKLPPFKLNKYSLYELNEFILNLFVYEKRLCLPQDPGFRGIRDFKYISEKFNLPFRMYINHTTLTPHIRFELDQQLKADTQKKLAKLEENLNKYLGAIIDKPLSINTYVQMIETFILARLDPGDERLT